MVGGVWFKVLAALGGGDSMLLPDAGLVDWWSGLSQWKDHKRYLHRVVVHASFMGNMEASECGVLPVRDEGETWYNACLLRNGREVFLLAANEWARSE